MLMMTFSPMQLQENRFEEHIVPNVEARQDAGEVNCSGLTFEDLFEYDFAHFELEILDDWATSNYYANSWVNGSN